MAAAELMISGRPAAVHAGFTLVEVMVALVIFTVSLLGLAGLQASSLRNTQLAYVNTVATQLAYDMGERIRANREGAEAGNYNIDNINNPVSAPSADCYASSCSAAEIALTDAYEWLSAIVAELPSGKGQVVENAGVYTITIMWDQERKGATGTDCGGGSEDLVCLQIQVRI